MRWTAAGVVAPNAAATAGGAVRCSRRKMAWISMARVSILRCRPTGFECRADLGQTQPGALLGSGCATQHGQRVTVGERIEGLQGRGVVLPQTAAQHVG